MWEGGKSCSLNEQESATPEPGAGGFFPRGRWSGGQGDTLFQLFQPWEVGTCGLPCLWHANHSPKQEKHFQVADIPFHTQRCSRAPVQIHRALPVHALQPVIILKATIITIETHVMGLGSRAWLIPTSIPEERKRGVPRLLVLCPAGRDQMELQGIRLRVRRRQQPGPQAVGPQESPRWQWPGWESCRGVPLLLTSPQPFSGSHRKSVTERTPIFKTCCLSSGCKLQYQNISSPFSHVSPELSTVSPAPFPMSDTKIKPGSDTAPFPLPASFTSTSHYCFIFMRKELCKYLWRSAWGVPRQEQWDE